MSKSAKYNSAKNFILLCLAVLIVLLLASINIRALLSPRKVLGTETNIETRENLERTFWVDFLNKNPDYIPGWIEIGRMDKVKEIDPNYTTP